MPSHTSVISLVCPGFALPHVSVSMNLADIGPNRTPIATAGTTPKSEGIHEQERKRNSQASPRYHFDLILTEMIP